MKILLIYPDYPTKWDPEESPHGYYSEGLASISAVLKSSGHNVELLHLKHPPDRKKDVEQIKYLEPDLIGISCRTTLFDDVVKLAKWLKEDIPDVPLIVGGYHPTLSPDSFMQIPGKPFDFICVGEGEFPLLELATKLDDGVNTTDIGNLLVKVKDEYIVNPTRPLIEVLDKLPLPDLDLFTYDKLYSLRLGIAPVMISRGCPFRCTYCCNHQIRKVYPDDSSYVRYRSPENAIEYIKTILSKRKNIRYINFMDNILPLKKKWFFKFIELYKSQIKIPFSARYHAGIFDREVIKKLAEGGCYQIHIGVESGNEFLRYNILKRKMTDKQIVEVFDTCREFNISTLSYNIVGLPYENKERFLETVKLNARIKPSRRILSVYFPYPETDLYNIAKEANFLVKEFNLKDEFYLSQPQFSHEEVLFCQRTFSPLITIYRLIKKIHIIGSLLEKTLDRVYISRKFPHRPVIKMADYLRWIYSKTKSFIGRLSPELYQFLRRKLLRS